MSIASRIQEIETHIGNAYTSIDNLGIDISNTNKNIYNISTLLDTFYESLPKVSGIGASLSLSPSLMGKIKLNEIQGDTLQDGTPSPSSPVSIQSVTGLQNVDICGKNLFNKDNANVINAYFDEATTTITSNANNRVIYIPCKANTTYTITKYASPYKRSIAYTTEKPNIGVQIYDQVVIPSNGTTGTITTGNNAKYLVIRLMNTSQDTITETQMLASIQIELGSTATDYEPYKGNTYEVNLGKNLFDKDNVNTINGYFTGSGTTTITGHNSHRIIYIPCNPNTTYTVQKLNEGSNKRFALATSETIPTINGTIMQSTGQQNNQDSLTITINSTANYLLVWCYVTNDTQVTWQEILDSIQIEKGSQATSYSEYFTPIELNKIGDYKDYIFKNEPNNPNYDSNLTLNSWYITKNIGKVVLDGSNDENWGTWFSTTGVYYSANYISSLTDSADTINCICDKYQANTRAYLRNNLSTIDNVCAVNGGELILANKSITSVSDFKNWLSNNNVIMYYIYARSVAPKIVITNTELINQLESLNNAKSEDGTTNINVTSEDLSMILNVGVLKGE